MTSSFTHKKNITPVNKTVNYHCTTSDKNMKMNQNTQVKNNGNFLASKAYSDFSYANSAYSTACSVTSKPIKNTLSKEFYNFWGYF